MTKPGPEKFPFGQDVQLWPASTETSPTPVALEYEGIFNVSLEVPKSFPDSTRFDVDLKISNHPSSSDKEHDFAFAQVKDVQADASGSIQCTVKTASRQVPWGGRFSMDVYVNARDSADGSQYEQKISTIPAELYFLTPDIAPAFQSGVPLEFVSLFVLPPNIVQSYSPDFWTERVVRLCHLSGWDTETPQPRYAVKALTGDANCVLSNGASTVISAIHWYRYSAYDGHSSFYNGGDKIIFDLPRWLRYRNDQTKKFTVNCYDQAHLVNCALYLGLPFNLPGKPDMTTIGIYYKGSDGPGNRFGYIKTLDLVGWGLCNSPFFVGSKSRLKIETVLNSKTRESFTNHEWVCIRYVDETGAVKGRAVDACAGPFATPDTVHKYLDVAIDDDPKTLELYTSEKTLQPYKDWDPAPGPNDYLMAPVRTVALVSGGMNVDVAWSSLSKNTNDFWEKTRNKGWTITKPYAGGVNISSLFKEIVTAGSCQESERETEINPAQTYITASFTNASDATDSPFLLMEVAVFLNRESAILDTLNQFNTTNAALDEIYAVPSTRRGAYDLQSAKENGNKSVVIYENVRIDMDGSAPESTFNAVMQAIDTHFVTSQKNPVPIPDAEAIGNSVNVTCPGTASQGSQFDISVKVSLIIICLILSMQRR